LRRSRPSSRPRCKSCSPWLNKRIRHPLARFGGEAVQSLLYPPLKIPRHFANVTRRGRQGGEIGHPTARHPRNVLESAIANIDGYAQKFDEAAALEDKSDILNWALNYLASGISGNLRLDLLAGAQAALARAAALEQPTKLAA
jgi:hypothetical protein